MRCAAPLLSLLFFACGGGSAETPPSTAAAAPGASAAAAASAMQGDLEWRLDASATTLSMAERAAWRLRTVATNRGSAPVDFFASGSAAFTVAGEASMVLDLAFGNGAAPSDWSALAPGATAAPERGPGESIFPAPGDYEIVMTHGPAVVGLVVHVTP